MNLEKWLNEQRITAHETSCQEIRNLIEVVDRDIKDASIETLSPDRRFNIAYNAALQLATILLHCRGFRTHHARGGHHWITFSVLPDLLEEDVSEYAVYFDTCRIKRNASDYTKADEISESEAHELLEEVKVFKDFIINWVQQHYSELLPA